MTRPPKRLQDNLGVEHITPQVAISMLMYGLLSDEDAASFKPANVTVDALIKMLKRANEVRNRTVAVNTVDQYARDMTNGSWLWTGEAVQIDHDGFVRNGQHRLLAIIQSKVPQNMVVVRNLDPKAQMVIDTGRNRRTADQLHMRGVRHAPAISSAMTTLMRWRLGRVMSTMRPSVSEVSAIIDSEPEIEIACGFALRLRMRLRRSPSSAIIAAYIEAGHVDPEARDQFFNSLLDGVSLDAKSPILLLRNSIIRSRTHEIRFRQAGQLYLIIHAWNLWRKNKTAQLLRVPPTLTSDTFPRMI